MLFWHNFALLINGLLMLAWPFAIGHWLFRRRRVDWGLFLVGATTFVLSQVGHIPFNAAIFSRVPGLGESVLATAIFAGLSAGIFEEVARALTYRFWARGASRRVDGLMVGLGHGGIEAILLGFLVLINGYFLVRAGTGSPSPLIPAAQEPIIAATLENLRDQSPWWLLTGAVERLFALALHLALSLLVLRAVRERRATLLLAAIGWHGLTNAGAVLLVARAGVLAAEGFLLLVALASVGLIWRWRDPDEGPAMAPASVEPVAMAPPAATQAPTAEQLDRTRYH